VASAAGLVQYQFLSGCHTTSTAKTVTTDRGRSLVKDHTLSSAVQRSNAQSNQQLSRERKRIGMTEEQIERIAERKMNRLDMEL